MQVTGQTQGNDAVADLASRCASKNERFMQNCAPLLPIRLPQARILYIKSVFTGESCL